MPQILLVNPPVYDFSAYDFWSKHYGMLRSAGADPRDLRAIIVGHPMADEQQV